MSEGIHSSEPAVRRHVPFAVRRDLFFPASNDNRMTSVCFRLVVCSCDSRTKRVGKAQ